jgi:hypothetical protein
MERKFTIFDKKGFLGRNTHGAEIGNFELSTQKAKAQHQVAMYMLQAFVEHKGQKYLPLMFQELGVFIAENGPIIEDIHQRIKIRNNTKFGKLSAQVLEKSLRKGISDARSGLAIYKNTIERVSKYLTRMLDSNYSAQQFLQDQYGISAESSAFFAEDLKLQWAATYGLLLDRLRQIIAKVAVMHKCLDMQIKLYHQLEDVPESFVHAVGDEEELQKWFRLERNSFHKCVNLAKLSTHEVGQIQNVMKAQAYHLKQALKTHLHIMKTGMQDEITENEDNIEKSLVIFGFVLRAAVVGVDINKRLLKKTLSFGTSTAAGKLEVAAGNSSGLLNKLVGDQKKAARYIKQFIRILEHLPNLI